MRTGEFASRAGVSASAIRFYEKRGPLSPSRCQVNGYRRYVADDLRIIRLIDQARSPSFSLNDVARFMSRPPGDRRDRRRLAPIPRVKLAVLDQHLAAVQKQRAAVVAFITLVDG